MQFKAFRERQWKIWEEKKELKIHYIDEESGIRSVKSEIIINKPLKLIYDYCDKLENKGKYDKNYDSGHIIRNLTENNINYSLIYQKYRGKLGVSPRDFTIIVRKTYDEQGESSFFATSFVSEKHPKVNKVERADFHFGGFVFKKLDESNTLVNFFSSSDLHLSQWMVNMTLKEVASCVQNIKDLLK